MKYKIYNYNKDEIMKLIMDLVLPSLDGGAPYTGEFYQKRIKLLLDIIVNQANAL
jgi:hypothetical protein